MAAGAAAHSKHGDRTDGLCTPPHRSAATLLWWTALGSAAVAETADAAAILPSNGSCWRPREWRRGGGWRGGQVRGFGEAARQLGQYPADSMYALLGPQAVRWCSSDRGEARQLGGGRG